MALIRTQRSEYDLHFQLRVDNLRALFDVPLGMTAGTKIYSDRVGPGLYLYLRPALTPNKKYVCSLYLATTETKRTASLSLDVEVAVRSLRGVKYYTRAFRTVFEKSVESAMGWYEFMTVEQYENSQTMRWENAIVLEVTIRSFAPKTSIRNNAALDTLHKTLTSANLLDTVFLLFASRSRTGRLTRPRQFFVSKSTFEDCSELPQRCTLKDIAHTLGGVSMSREQREANIYNATTDDLDYDSDFEAEAEMDDSKDQMLHRIEGLASEHERNYTGPVIVLPTIPARTWEALLYYLQTSVIVFAPLSSHGETSRDAFVATYFSSSPHRPMPSSCKSIYRIADTLGLIELKKRALEHLEAELTPGIILDELFSLFTSRYNTVTQLELAMLDKWWDELQASPVLSAKMQDIASGGLPHAGPVMTELWRRMTARIPKTLQ